MGDDAIAVLQVHPWPGNVRQLRNNVERLLILATGDPDEPISADMLPQEATNADSTGHQPGWRAHNRPAAARGARGVRARVSGAQIMRFGGNISRTAAFIGMERSALHRKLKSLGVSPARGGEDDIEEAVLMGRVAYVNGQYQPHGEAVVHVEDRGFQFADGVYEVWSVCSTASWPISTGI